MSFEKFFVTLLLSWFSWKTIMNGVLFQLDRERSLLWAKVMGGLMADGASHWPPLSCWPLLSLWTGNVFLIHLSSIEVTTIRQFWCLSHLLSQNKVVTLARLIINWLLSYLIVNDKRSMEGNCRDRPWSSPPESSLPESHELHSMGVNQ